MVQFDKVHKIYRNEKGDPASMVNAMVDVSFDVDQGEFVIIKGRSGSGKTTLLQLLGGLMHPSRGSIQVQGKEMAHATDAMLNQYRGTQVGFVFQDFNLIDHITVLDNVMVPALFYHGQSLEVEKKARHLLDLVGLSEKAEQNPVYLSGGQKQRVAIARALLRDPKIILADEPTGNLDSETGLQIEQLLHRICKDYGVTVFLVTHDERVTEYAHRLMVMENGHLVKNEVLKSLK